MYIDFQALKARVSIEEVSVMLGLTLSEISDDGQRRAPCPRCKDGGERALVITEGKGYYCFSAKVGGDCIALAAHIRDLSMKDAAHYIVEHLDAEPDTEQPEDPEENPEQEPRQEAQQTKPLQPLSYLHYQHDAVQALGIDAKTAESLGIGYAKKGMMRGRVAIPIRTDTGTLVGYCGYAHDADPILKFPKSLASL